MNQVIFPQSDSSRGRLHLSSYVANLLHAAFFRKLPIPLVLVTIEKDFVIRLDMNTLGERSADKMFKPEKYGMMFCPECVGLGRRKVGEIMSVCEVCGGFGLIVKENEKHGLYWFPVRCTG